VLLHVQDYNDVITQNQVQELAVLNGDSTFPASLVSRGGRTGPQVMYPPSCPQDMGPPTGPVAQAFCQPDGTQYSGLGRVQDIDARIQQEPFPSFNLPR